MSTRCLSALVSVAVLTAAVAGCAGDHSAADGATRSPAATSSPQQSPAATSPADPRTTPSDDALARISAALETAGVEDLGPAGQNMWQADLTGTWRGGPVFAWAVAPEAVDQVVEVRRSVELEGAEEKVTAVVHGPELTLVRVPCDDLVVDVAAGVDVDQGTSDEDGGVELARALYPALGC
jgi:hypothetical protein